jgi:hypothetical protein
MRSSRIEENSLDQLAYELSARALERQERKLDELRARTGILIGVSSLAASFLGARAADAGSGLLTFVALGSFVASILLMALILMPVDALIFSLRGTALLEAERDDPRGLTETYRRLAYWVEMYLDDNEPLLNARFRRYRWATALVVVQVVLWVAEIVI